MSSVSTWLDSLALGQYATIFDENAIDLSVVGDLTEQDLKDLGMQLGYRRKLLRAITVDGAALTKAQTAAEPVPRDYGSAEFHRSKRFGKSMVFRASLALSTRKDRRLFLRA
jgi:hypothetical protein